MNAERARELRRLKWLAILAPLVFLGVLEALRQALEPDLPAAWVSFALYLIVVLLGTLAFAEAIFRVIGRTQARVAQRNRELLALHEAGLAITGERDLETVLQTVVDEARELVGARYGALSLLRDGDGIEALLTSGLTREERARLGPLPAGHGLLGAMLADDRPLRLADLTRDPRSVGFPPGHPPMRSLLAVPIVARGRTLGNLYLTEREGAAAFSPDDEETLGRFATQAALAIENARLLRQVRALAITEERERIAREMHDSLAQVLGYVNTKAQAAQTLLDAGQTARAATQLDQLAESARAAYADVREGILGLRTSLGQDRGLLDALRAYLDQWQGQSGVAAELVTVPAADFAPALSPLAEVQLLRIVQEALANVRKHAQATQVCVRVCLDATGEALAVAVTDNGVGFAPDSLARSAFPRFGLATMRERAEAIGATLSIDSAPGQGTRLSVRIPTERAALLAAAGAGAATGLSGAAPDARPHR